MTKEIFNSSNTANLMLYPLAGTAVGVLIAKNVIPLNALQSALWVGGLTSTTAMAEYGLQSIFNLDETRFAKVALGIGATAAIYFAALSSYGVSLFGRLSYEVTKECMQTLLISSFISYATIALQQPQPVHTKKTRLPIPTPIKETPKPTKEKAPTSTTKALPEKATVQKTTVQALYGDIMLLPVEAIVNAANEVLLGGGGIDGAIHSKAGVELYNECKKIPLLKGSATDRIKTGDAVITSSYKIQEDQPMIKYVVHTAGPRGSTPNRQKILANAYRNSMEVARLKGIRSIAFPAISVGIFGYPFAEAQELAYQTVRDFIKKHPTAFDTVLFSYLTRVIDQEKATAIHDAWKKTF
ncbi:macro domain-containing protein [Simkania sp.]|uniref:macro domain-containing protein n=1 Tax=Simkania sp. TaxID=34094 RepID=UPI003B523F49